MTINKADKELLQFLYKSLITIGIGAIGFFLSNLYYANVKYMEKVDDMAVKIEVIKANLENVMRFMNEKERREENKNGN